MSIGKMLICCVKLDHALYSINYGIPTTNPVNHSPSVLCSRLRSQLIHLLHGHLLLWIAARTAVPIATSACIPSLKITASPFQPYTVIHENFIVKQFLFRAKRRKFFCENSLSVLTYTVNIWRMLKVDEITPVYFIFANKIKLNSNRV